MKIQYPDYENSIANLACSVLKAFGAGAEHATLPLADSFLKKPHKNTLVILLDGMGTRILEKHLDRYGFFRSHLVGSYSSVFPPTTVAATTSMDSGLFPAEHCWLGWDCYFKEIDRNVTVFRNTVSETGERAAEYFVAWKFCPYQTVADRIREAGYEAYSVTPFMDPFPQSFEEICDRIAELCAQDGRKYIYAYWNEPDTTMHGEGCMSKQAGDLLERLEETVEALCGKLKDTQVLITADHGHVDTQNVAITGYPRIMECLVRMPSIEPRALNLFVKEGYERQLKEEFAKEFGDKFMLLSKEEVKQRKLFGPGRNHERFDEMVGDYVAVAVSDLTIFNTEEEARGFIGVHAGMTEAEMMIPLIAVTCP